VELRGEFVLTFLADFEVTPDDMAGLTPEVLLDRLLGIALDRFEQRRRQLGDELFNSLLRVALLRTLDAKWRDHLYALDLVREGINLRAYGQKDPLIEYKQESFRMFDEMMADFRKEALTFLFRAELKGTPSEPRRPARPLHAYKPDAARSEAGIDPSPAAAPGQPARRTADKVGRNDPCPCGSGRKYKKCCGKAA
jgi:preprotein translocase subunit SecA